MVQRFYQLTLRYYQLTTIADSIFLSCSSELQELQIGTRVAFKSMIVFCYFYIFHNFCKLYKELLELTFLACLLTSDNLCEVLGCSVITDFISTMFGFQKLLADK